MIATGMGRKGIRLPTSDERSLWAKVTRKVTALHPEKPKAQPSANCRAEPDGAVAGGAVRKPIPEFRIGERGVNAGSIYEFVPNASQYPELHPSRMDKKMHGRLKRGKLEPETRIDLHGMTKAQALPELSLFIHEAHVAGRRLVLVITGKGRNRERHEPMTMRGGVLKRLVPHWLGMRPLSNLVLQVTEAHPKHGGSGAYYVYLRRRT